MIDRIEIWEWFKEITYFLSLAQRIYLPSTLKFLFLSPTLYIPNPNWAAVASAALIYFLPRGICLLELHLGLPILLWICRLYFSNSTLGYFFLLFHIPDIAHSVFSTTFLSCEHLYGCNYHQVLQLFILIFSQLTNKPLKDWVHALFIFVYSDHVSFMLEVHNKY